MQTLRRAREAAKLSQRDLGKVAGCSGPMIYQIETDQVKPGAALAIRLGAALGVSAVELFPDLASEINAVLAAVAATPQAASDS